MTIWEGMATITSPWFLNRHCKLSMICGGRIKMNEKTGMKEMAEATRSTERNVTTGMTKVN